MPQFNFSFFVPQVAWLALFFAILYFGIVKATLPRLARTVDQREGKVSGDIAAAEKAKADADGIHEAYEAEMAKAHADAHAAIAEAKAKAVGETETALGKANAELDARQDKAFAALEIARARADTEIEAVAADAAADIVDKLSGFRPAEADALLAVRHALAA